MSRQQVFERLAGAVARPAKSEPHTYGPSGFEVVRAFYCCQCKAWVRERPPLTPELIEEALRLNGPRERWKITSTIGNRRLVEGTLTIAVNTRDPGLFDPGSEIRRYCPKCAPIAKDALLQLGFNLGVT